MRAHGLANFCAHSAEVQNNGLGTRPSFFAWLSRPFLGARYPTGPNPSQHSPTLPNTPRTLSRCVAQVDEYELEALPYRT